METLYLAAEKIQLDKHWTSFWGGLTKGWPQLTTVLGIIAVALAVVFAVVWFWRAKKNGSGMFRNIPWGWLVPAVLFAAPGVILPMVLKAASFIANMIIALISLATG